MEYTSLFYLSLSWPCSQINLTLTYRLNQVSPVHFIYYQLLCFDTWEESCRTFRTLLYLQLLSVATLSLSFYKLLIWCVGLHSFCIKDWQHSHTLHWLVAQYSVCLTPVVYLIRRANLPRRSSILLSTTCLNKLIKYLKFSGLPSKTSISTSGADCYFNNWHKTSETSIKIFWLPSVRSPVLGTWLFLLSTDLLWRSFSSWVLGCFRSCWCCW